MMQRYLMSLCALSLLAVSSIGAAAEDDITRMRNALQAIQAMRRLPNTGMSLVDTGSFSLLVSDTGRFVVYNGKLLDMWSNTEIHSVADLDRALAHLDLKRLKLDFKDLGAFEMGGGPTQVTLFLDPMAAASRAVLKQLPALSDQYRFRLVLLPLEGAASVETAKRLLCTEPELALKALLAGSYDKLRAPTNPCSLSPLQKTVITAKLLGIDTVPFLITAAGATQRGKIEDVASFLKANP